MTIDAGQQQFTSAELATYDGTVEGRPIYVAIKSQVFDVSLKREMYGPGGSYHVFAGKDASKALGKSSLKTEDISWDFSMLSVEELRVLDDWEAYFKKRYPIVGTISATSY